MNGTASAVANNSSVVVGSTNGRPIAGTVEQGPRWLAGALYGGVPGLEVALSAVAVAVILLAALSVRRNGLPSEAVGEARENVVMAVGALVTTYAVTTYLSLPYVADALLGGLGGAALGSLVLRVALDVVYGPDEDGAASG